MVAAQTLCLQQSDTSARENGKPTALRRPRNKEVTSRYMSPAPAPIRRFPSPNVDRIATLPDVASPKRAQSAERTRPSPTRTRESTVSNNSLDPSMVAKRPPRNRELLWPSTRNLSSSMQGEPFSPPSNCHTKTHTDCRGKGNRIFSDHTLRPSANVVQKPSDHRKPTPERKGTPLRSRTLDQVENARPLNIVHTADYHRKPGNINGRISGAAMSRSVDLSNDRERTRSKAASLLLQGKPGISASKLARPITSSAALSQSINAGPAIFNSPQKTRADSRGKRRDSPVKTSKIADKESLASLGLQQSNSSMVQPNRQSAQAVELASAADASVFAVTPSYMDCVSAGGSATTSLSRVSPGNGAGGRAVQGTTVTAGFCKDGLRRPSESNRLHSSTPERESPSVSVQRSGNTYPGSSAALNGLAASSHWSVPSNRSISAFVVPQQPLSPVRTSPYRNIPSPARTRGSPLSLPLQSQRSSSAVMMLSFGADTRKGRKGLTQIEEAHLHRILHNRLLQWQFVNARAEAATETQIFAAEKALYNVCARIFELQSSVTTKRIRLQQARRAHKLRSLLLAQVPKLDVWSSLQSEHSSSLTGALQALDATVLQVPVTGGVKADALAVKEAIKSANDVMNSVENSVAYLLPKAEKTDSLVCELAYVAAQEKAFLEECADLLVTASTLEVEERSLKTHLVQLEQERARVLVHLMENAAALPDSL